jgi:capsular polysaccharide biosynthesis protein
VKLDGEAPSDGEFWGGATRGVRVQARSEEPHSLTFRPSRDRLSAMFKRFWWMFPVMLAVGSVVGLLVAGVMTYVMPKKYESETVVELRPSARSGNGVAAAGVDSKSRFDTELEKIRSRNILGRVVDNLKLGNQWSMDKETTIRILKMMVVTQQIKSTDLVSIRVRHTNKQGTSRWKSPVLTNHIAWRQTSGNRNPLFVN